MFSICCEAAANPFNFCVRLIKISILYLFPVVSAGFFVRFSWRGYSSPHMNSALTASFSVRQPPNEPFVLSCPPARPRLPCGCRRRCKGFPSASSWPWPFGDRNALSGSRTSLPSQSPSLWQVPSLCRPTAYSSSMAVSDLLSRRRISGSGCCRSAVPAVSDSSVPCTSSGTSGQLSLQEWRTTCVPTSASCFSLPDRSSLPSRGEGAVSYPAQFALLESWIVELVKIELRKRNVWRYFRKISYFWHAD